MILVGTSLGILSSIMAGCVLSDTRKTVVGAPLYKQGYFLGSLTLSPNFDKVCNVLLESLVSVVAT